MKRLLIYLIILIFPLNIYSQQITITKPIICYSDVYDFYEENVNGLSVYRWKKNNKKVSEYICLERPFNTIHYDGHEGEGLMVDGLRHGRWKLRKCGSSVRHEINYNKGLITGHYKVFITITTVKDKYKGQIVNFYLDKEKIQRSDTILYETNFVNGNGEWKDFFAYFDEDTWCFAISETGYYKDGKKSGEWCYYYTTGFLYRKEYYENGILVKEENFNSPKEYEGYIEKMEY